MMDEVVDSIDSFSSISSINSNSMIFEIDNNIKS